MNEDVLTEQMVEEELSAFQSLSGGKTVYAGERPSQQALDAVHIAAVRSASRRLFARRVSAFVKVAAVLCLVSGAAWYLAGARKTSKAPSVVTVNTGSLSEEELLLDIQGMDDESFFALQEEAFLL
ncbi:MAG: hypothetical protein J5985_03240 [Kiritimatiellae bacterium]|nr:hypothetical protein [Kiritimatiellia bacterium]